MITKALIDIFTAVIGLLLTPLTSLSDVSLSSDITSAISTAKNAYDNLSSVLPTAAILAAFGILVGVEVAIFSYKAIMWLVKKIPTIS